MNTQIPIDTRIELTQNVWVEYTKLRKGTTGVVMGYSVNGKLMVKFDDLTLSLSHALIDVEKVTVYEYTDEEKLHNSGTQASTTKDSFLGGSN